MRSIPAGLLLLIVGRKLPHGIWWWRSLVLGILNIGAFFALLFVAAEHLPGGVASTIGSVQPLFVTVLASFLVSERLTRRRIFTGLASIAGVVLLVNQSPGKLDAIGVGAALTAAATMSIGIVLAKRWGQPATPIVTTSWQLIAGGLVLLLATLAAEGLPSIASLAPRNIAGFSYLTLIGTTLAYTLWFRGIEHLPVSSVAFLGLLSPIIAVMCGWIFLNQSLSIGQIAGAIVVIGAVLFVNLASRKQDAPLP